MSKCPNCDSTSFGSSRGKAKRYNFVTCNKCDTVVGVDNTPLFEHLGLDKVDENFHVIYNLIKDLR